VDALTQTGASLQIQEDQSNDTEINHTTETFDIFAIEGTGQLTGILTEIV